MTKSLVVSKAQPTKHKNNETRHFIIIISIFII